MWMHARHPAETSSYAVSCVAPCVAVGPGAVCQSTTSISTLRSAASSFAPKNAPVMRSMSASSFCSTHSSDDDSSMVNDLPLAWTSHGNSQASPLVQWSPSRRETEASLLQRACRVYETVKQRLAESRRQLRGMRSECQVLAQSVNQLHRDHQQAEEYFLSTARWHLKRRQGLMGITQTSARSATRRQRSAPAMPIGSDRLAGNLGSASGSNMIPTQSGQPPCRARPRSASTDHADAGGSLGGVTPCAPVTLRVAPWQGKWRLAAELPAAPTSIDAVPPPVVSERSPREEACRDVFGAYASLSVASLPADSSVKHEVVAVQLNARTSASQEGHLRSSQHAGLCGNMRQHMLPAVPPQELSQALPEKLATPAKKESSEAFQSTLDACSTVCGTASPATPPSISGTEITSPSRPSPQIASSQTTSSQPLSRLPTTAHAQLPPPPPQTKSNAVHFSQEPEAVQMRQAEAELQEELKRVSLTFSELKNLRKQLQGLEQEATRKLQTGQVVGFCANSAQGSSNRSVGSAVSTRRGSDASGPQVPIGGEQCGGSACSSDISEVQDVEVFADDSHAARRPKRRMKTAKIAHQNLEKIFTHCDRDGDGTVNKRDLIKVCKESDEVADFLQLPRQIHQEDQGARVRMEHLFQAADQDNDRQITWEEFRSFYLSGAEQRLQDMFKLLDRNGDGQVEPEELIKVCQRHEEVQEFFDKRHELDGRGAEAWEVVANDLCRDSQSGSITYDAFRSFYMKRKSVLAEAPHAEKLPAKCRTYTVSSDQFEQLCND